MAVLCIDLDRFKEVNDTYGHHVGDELIREAGRRMAAQCRSCDTFYRLSGDEFAIVQTQAEAKGAGALADRLGLRLELYQPLRDIGHGLAWVVRAMLARWRAAGNRLEGLQIDFDAATPGLHRYRAFLEGVRRELPPGTRLSITGLLDWSANGDPAELAKLAGLVDEVVIQTYQGHRTIPGYGAWFRQIDSLPLRHKIALVEGGEWTPPAALARDKRFAGYVVFLLKPAVSRPPSPADRGSRQP